MGVDDEQGPWWTRPPENGPDSGNQRTRHRPDDPALGTAPDGADPPAEPSDDDPFAPFALTQPAPPAAGPTPTEPPAAQPPEQPTWTPPPTAQRGPWDTPPEEQPTVAQQPVTQSPFAQPAPPVEPPTQVVPSFFGPPPEEPAVEPEQPPRPRTPNIRRVAVVRPGSPGAELDPGGVEPGSARRDDTARTETLPPVQDDIFAVFAGPGAQPTARSRPPEPDAYPPDPRDPDPLSHLRDDPHERHLPHVPLPSPRVLLIGAAGGLVVVLIVVTALLTGGGSDGDKQADPAAARTSAAQPTGTKPKGLRQLDAGEAANLLARAGAGDPGTIVEAWDWTDRNGQNLVVTARSPGSRGKTNLKVIQVAQLDQKKPHTLRVMRDPNLPAKCKGSGTAGFTPGALLVRDLNDDGIAEVTAGWTSRCGSAPTVAKLALITDGKKFIIRGDGTVGQKGSGSTVPDPKTSNWPKAFLKQAQTLFSKLYY